MRSSKPDRANLGRLANGRAIVKQLERGVRNLARYLFNDRRDFISLPRQTPTHSDLQQKCTSIQTQNGDWGDHKGRPSLRERDYSV